MPWIVTVRCRNGITFELYFNSREAAETFILATLNALQVLSCTLIDDKGAIAGNFNK